MPQRRTLLAAGATVIIVIALAVGPVSSRLQLVHLVSLLASYLLIGATAAVSGAYLRSSQRRGDLDRRAGALAQAVSVTLSLSLVSGAAWSYSFSLELWLWESRLTSLLIVMLSYRGYLAVRRLDASGTHRATRSAVVALAAAGQIPFLWASLLIWQRTPTEGAELIPSVWTFENESAPIRIVMLFAATLLLVASFVHRQEEIALAADREGLESLEQAIIDRRNETR